MISNELIQKYNVLNFDQDKILEYVMNKYNIDEPFYIVNLNEIINTYKRWINCLPLVKPYYAMKCNPNSIIIEVLNELGCCFDCASKKEMMQIMAITNNPDKIIFAHPCKYPSHIKYAYENNIDLMTFDSEDELYKINELHKDAKLVLRLAVDDSHSLCRFNKKFGLNINQLQNIFNTINILQMDLVGFSFHVGSGCTSAKVYYEALKTCSYATIEAKKNNIDIKLIDLGGGFVATGNSFEEFAKEINKGINDFFKGTNIKFIAEPGRFMVQTSHTLFLTVIAKKTINNEYIYYLNDGVYGSFNCIVFDHQNPDIIPIEPIGRKIYKSKLFGNTCDSMDEIKSDILLPELYVGDRLYVKDFGAYTTSAKSDHFNGYSVQDFIYIYKK